MDRDGKSGVDTARERGLTCERFCDWGDMVRRARENVLRKGLRFLAGAASSLVFFFTLSFAAWQSPSSPQTHPSQSGGALSEAESSLAHGNPEDAIRILSEHLKTHPADIAARTMLGQAFASAGQDDRAAGEFQTVLQAAPEDFVALASLGEIYARGGQTEKAEPLLAHAVRINRAPQIRIEWAVVLARLHKYKDAQNALAGLAAPSGREESVRFHRLKASVALGVGNAPAAASEMETALALSPADDALTLATAAAELQAKNWKRAAHLAEPLFSRTHEPRTGLVSLEAELEMHGDFNATLATLRATQLDSSEELAFRQRVAALLISHGEYSESIEDLKVAVLRTEMGAIVAKEASKP